MKSIQYRSYGDYSENRLVELPRPQLQEGEVLVQMRTVGVNPLDNTFRSGHIYLATPQNLPRIGGQTGAGAVVETKNDAFKVGDRVFVRASGFGLIADGTWREFVAAPAAALVSWLLSLVGAAQGCVAKPMAERSDAPRSRGRTVRKVAGKVKRAVADGSPQALWSHEAAGEHEAPSVVPRNPDSRLGRRKASPHWQ